MGQWRGGDLAVLPASLSLGLSWDPFLSEPETEGMAGSEESSLVIPLSVQLLVHAGVPGRPQRIAAVRTWRADVLKSHSISFALSPRYQLMAPPSASLPRCHGRLGFLGMGFAACYKSHCQGFPIDPEPNLWGRHQHQHQHQHHHQGCCQGMRWQRGPGCLRLAWGAGLSCL